MIERFKGDKLTWIDILNPTADEIREVMEEANLPPELVSDLSTPVPRSYVNTFGGVIKVTLDYPIVKRTDINHPHEIKLLATKSHLITVHFEDIQAIYKFKKEFELLSILKNTKTSFSGMQLLNTLMMFFYHSLNEKLDYLESKLTDVENEIFKGREKEMVFEISNISRRIITFKHVLSSHEPVLNDLFEITKKTLTKDIVLGTNKLKEQYEFLINRIVTIKETMDELRETNMALLTTKQNETMKTLTILAFITFPLTLFTSMFGMNTQTTPILGQKNDFWIIVGIMALVSIGFFVYFKYKRWI